MQLALYINDNLLVRDVEAIDKAIETFKEKWHVLKIMEGLQDYLSCKVRVSMDKSGLS